MNRKDILELVTKLVGNAQTAETVVNALSEAGVLHVGFGDAEVDIIVDKFKDTFGTTKTTKYDRFAASRLAKKYGSQAVVGVIDLLASKSGEKYVPVVGNVSQLEEKWVSVLNFLRNSSKGAETIDA